MTLPCSIRDREADKFCELPVSKKTAVRICTESTDPIHVVDATSSAMTPTIVNVVSPVGADTEFTVAIPDGANQFTFRARGSSRLKLAYTSGGPFITIPLGGWYRATGLSTTSVTLFLKCSKSSQTIEVETWT